MKFRTITAVALFALAAAGCDRKDEKSAPALGEGTDEPAATATPLPEAPLSAPASEAAPAKPKLDTAALSDRKDPDRVLRYYAAALAARDWAAAAKAWGPGAGVTATTLKQSYDRPESPVLEIGKGDQEGAAGSIYYEAPVTLRFGDAPPERGSLVLKRVNDVDGASAEQLRWHIERSTIGAGQ